LKNIEKDFNSLALKELFLYLINDLNLLKKDALTGSFPFLKCPKNTSMKKDVLKRRNSFIHNN